MRHTLIIFSLFFPICFLAQDTLRIKKTLDSVVEPAEFPGGNQMMMKYLQANITWDADKYPCEQVCGKVWIEFIIDTTGNVKNVKVLKGWNSEVNQKVLSAFSTMPKWKPKKVNEKVVEAHFKIPITFKQ